MALISKYPLASFQLAFWLFWEALLLVMRAGIPEFSIASTFIINISGFVATGVILSLYERVRIRSRVFSGVARILTILVSAFIFGNVSRISWGEITLIEFFNAPFSHWVAGTLRSIWPFAIWFVCYLLVKLGIAHQGHKEALLQAQLETKKAQLMTLRYQLNPHFLFNVLNSIDVSVQSNDNNTAHLMIRQLSGFLRNSLHQGEQDKITLRSEMEIIEDFVNIARIRFDDKIALSTDIESTCLMAMLPPMLLQPLIENAIKYSWNNSDQGMIHIQAHRQLKNLVIEISNARQAQLVNEGTGTGLTNIEDRLELAYGEDANMEISENKQQFSVKLTLPFETAI